MPKVGETIYRLFENELHVDKVFAVAEKGFMLESFRTTKELYWWCEVADKNRTWFDNFDAAAACLLSAYDDDYELVHHDKTWYEVEKL